MTQDDFIKLNNRLAVYRAHPDTSPNFVPSAELAGALEENAAPNLDYEVRVVGLLENLRSDLLSYRTDDGQEPDGEHYRDHAALYCSGGLARSLSSQVGGGVVDTLDPRALAHPLIGYVTGLFGEEASQDALAWLVDHCEGERG